MGVCNDCRLGEASRKPVGSPVIEQAAERLGLVHSDLQGPLPESHGGSKYAIIFVDDLTRMGKVYPLKRKSDALKTYEREV